MQTSRHCKQCKRKTLHKTESFGSDIQMSMGHGCLIVLTCGLWLPIALLWAVASGMSRPRCQVCGRKN